MVSRLAGIFKRQKDGPDCEEVRNLSSDYIDGDLDLVTAEKVKSHLEACGPCNAFINTLRATVRLLRGTPKRDAPDDFRKRIRETLRRESQG